MRDVLEKLNKTKGKRYKVRRAALEIIDDTLQCVGLCHVSSEHAADPRVALHKDYNKEARAQRFVIDKYAAARS